jgi:hypothetical protein
MIRHISLEVEEREVSRTQELELSVSSDDGQSYRELRRQEYTSARRIRHFNEKYGRLPPST